MSSPSASLTVASLDTASRPSAPPAADAPTVGRAPTRLPWPTRHPALASGAVALLIVLVGAILSWERLPAATRATLWAEDSRDFLGNAVTQGALPPLFHVYAGYLHTVPRLIAAFTVTFVPVSSWAQAMAAGSCLVTGIVAATVFFCSRSVSSSWWIRGGLAAITILDPLSPREVLGNTANLHWYFLWLAPWVILYRTRTRAGTVAVAVVAALGALTEIQMLVFLPLLALRWKSGARLPVRLALLGGGLLQVVASLVSPRSHSTAAANPLASTVYGYFINCVMTIWHASGPTIGHALVQFGPLAAAVCAVPIAIAVAVIARFGTRDQRWMAVTLVVASAALWVFAVKTSPGVYYDYSTETAAQLAKPWITRYGVVPSMELIAVMVIALGCVRGRSRIPWLRVGLGAALLAVALTSFLPAGTRRAGGPELAPQVAAAKAFCSTRPASARVVLAAPPAAAWKIYLDCSWFGAAASGSGATR